MDPNQTYKDFCHALLEENKEAACESYNALRCWIEKGGFEPTWGENGRKQFFSFNPLTGRLE
jgi:hypothetical protein